MTNNQLKAIVERIEELEREKASTAGDIKGVYAEAKGNGYDVKALRTIIRMRKQDANELADHEALVAAYLNALGQLSDTPLGKAAMDKLSTTAAALT